MIFPKNTVKQVPTAAPNHQKYKKNPRLAKPDGDLQQVYCSYPG
jgi:hypothetical protein